MGGRGREEEGSCVQTDASGTGERCGEKYWTVAFWFRGCKWGEKGEKAREKAADNAKHYSYTSNFPHV